MKIVNENLINYLAVALLPLIIYGGQREFATASLKFNKFSARRVRHIDIANYENYLEDMKGWWKKLETKKGGIIDDDQHEKAALDMARSRFRIKDRDSYPLSFYGLSVIVRMNPQSQLCINFRNFQKELKAKFGDKIALVDPRACHLSISNIELGPNNGRSKLDGARAAQLIKQVDEVFSKILGNSKPIEVEVRGFGSFNFGLLFASIYPKAGDYEGLNRLLSIYENIRDGVRGNNMPPKDRRFNGHITFGYILEPFNEQEYAELLDLLKKYKDTLFGKLTIDEIELTYHSDLDTSVPLKKYKLNSPVSSR